MAGNPTQQILKLITKQTSQQALVGSGVIQSGATGTAPPLTSHSHSNKPSLDRLGVDADGRITVDTVAHGHAISEIAGLIEALSAKADAEHTHQTSEITGLDDQIATMQQAVDGKADADHTHSEYEHSNQTVLDGLSETADGKLAYKGQPVETGTGSGGATSGVFRATFEALTVWTVTHNLGDDPAVTVWRRIDGDGYGAEPYGDSPYGGTPTRWVVDMSPEIERINANSIRITWPAATSGRVICHG